jgi:hypothetical protein
MEIKMLENFLISLVTDMVAAPVRAEIAAKLADNAPPEVVQQIEACVAEAPPALVRRAQADPTWFVSAGVRVVLQSATPEQVLREAIPQCEAALKAAQPYLAKVAT